MVSIQFLGAARTVTGSKHLLEWDGHRVLVDCGLFQGFKKLRLMNWEPFPVEVSSIDAVVLTHAHVDHLGYLPRLVKEGFEGPIYATDASCDLAEIMLRDSAHIQEEDARWARKRGFSKHKDPQPLYTTQDAEKVFPMMQAVPYNKPFPILGSANLLFRHAGHILGSAFVEVGLPHNGKQTKILFSGDVGRYDQPMLLDPDPPTEADYMLLECTYGNRLHGGGNPKAELAEIINRTIQRGGTVVIPAFALGRSQILLTYLAQLFEEWTIPRVDVFLDSPMAVSTTWETRSHTEELDQAMLRGIRNEKRFNRPEFHYLTTREQSQQLNDRKDPCVIISASGMATAGRILHHLGRLLPDPKNTAVFVGYQAEGTRGRRLIEGEKQIKIHGAMVPVNAEIVNLSDMSSHADYSEMMPWLRKMNTPKRVFLVHGEDEGLQAMQQRLATELGWDAVIPDLNQTFELDVDAITTVAERAKQRPAPVPEPAWSPKAIPGVVALVAWDRSHVTALERMPGAVVFREKPTEELAERLVAAHIFREVVLLHDPETGETTPDFKPFIDLLKKAGVPVWKLCRMDH